MEHSVAQPLINAQVLFDRADVLRRKAHLQVHALNAQMLYMLADACEHDAHLELARAKGG